MPELPEVEVLRRQLERRLAGAVVLATRADHDRYRLAGVAGATIAAVTRRGKYLELVLDDRRRIVLHLGMTGQLCYGYRPTGHVRLRIRTSRGDLFFRDPRKFGSALVVHAGADPKGLYGRLGQDPLDGSFDRGAAVRMLASSTAPVKTRLLTQAAVAGVGNYIADEALHRAGVHPLRRDCDESTLARLVDAVLAVVRESVAHGGVSERDYQHLDGGKGSYQRHLVCYGRAGLPCGGCGTALRRIVVGGRGSTYCPGCQSEND
jgi:formamidopyrimidine-DNA glycosylase